MNIHESLLNKRAITKIQGAIVAGLILVAAVIGSYFYLSSLTPPSTSLPEFYDPKVYNAQTMYEIRATLDPTMHLDGYHVTQMTHSYEGLVKYGTGLTAGPEWNVIKPCLATEWNVSEDVTSYTFKLRQGVKFHDGTTFNADAVKFSFERSIALKGAPGGYLAVISSIDVIDNYTVRFNFNASYGPFLALLATHPGKCIMSPTYVNAHATSDDPWANKWMESHICGTGPYTLKEIVVSDRLVLQKFDDYWGGWEPIEGKYPRIETINYIQVLDYSTAKLMLLRGEVDSIEHYTPADLPELDANPDTKVRILETWRTYELLFNFKRPPTDNIYVRKAFAYGINYTELVEALAPVGTMAQGFIPPGLSCYEPKSQFEYDPVKAKENLALAGFPNGTGLPPLELGILAGNEQHRIMGTYVAVKLAEIGITLNVVEKPSGTWKTLSGDHPEQFAHIFPWNNVGVFADPDSIVYLFFHSAMRLPFGFNFGHYNNTTVDEMIIQGRSLPEEERPEHYSTLLMTLKEDAAATAGYGLANVLTHREWLRGDIGYHPTMVKGYIAYTMYKSLD